jgi:hypothetical protein
MPMSIRKILGRTGLVLAALVALLLVTRAVLNYTTGKKLEKFLAAEKAKGVPVSYADLGPACPGLSNARPLWRAAEALFDDQHRGKVNLGEELANMYEDRPIGEKARSFIRAAIDRNRRSIDFLLEASGLPCFRETDRTDPFKIENLLTRLQLVRLLGFEAAFRAEAGDVRGGFDEWIKGLRFLRLTLQESNLLHGLVAIADARSLLAVLNWIVDERAVEIDALNAMLKELDVPIWRAAVAGSWKNERIMEIEAAREILRGHTPEYQSGLAMEFLFWLARPLVRSELKRRYPSFDEVDALFRKPFFESRPGMADYDVRHKRLPWYRRLPDGGISNISATGLKEASLEALMETARIGLAARIYQAREKRFPAAIADLVPDILPREPLDPFTGKPFVYRVDQNGLLVYSLGSNEKDDGGRGTYMITQLVMPKDDDWAWRDRIR